jgi:hypothetical protein
MVGWMHALFLDGPLRPPAAGRLHRSVLRLQHASMHIDVGGAAASPYAGPVTLHLTQLNPINSPLAVAVGGVSAYACSRAHAQLAS